MIRRVSIALMIFGSAVFGASSLAAQDHTWTASVFGGVGASVDEGGGTGLAFQLGGALQSSTNTNIWVKAGTFGLDTGDDAGALADGDLTYLVVGGEYQFFERYYHSGVFLGLGMYELDGRRVLPGGALGPSVGDTSIGLAVGVTGEFRITPSFAVVTEVMGHIIESDDTQVLATGLVGVAFHF